MKNNKQRTSERETIKGAKVSNVALNRVGIPQLSASMKFLTVGRTSGSVKVRGTK